MNISRNGPTPILLVTLLGLPLDRYPLGNSLLRMLCGASTNPYCPKSNRKTSNLTYEKKTAGLKPRQEESMNLRSTGRMGISSTSRQCQMIIALKWIYKVKLDEYGDVLKNKARLVAKGLSYKKKYLKDIAMALTAYTYTDHAGCQDTRRSTSSSAQFLGDKRHSSDHASQQQTGLLSSSNSMILFDLSPKLGYPKEVIQLVNVTTNDMFNRGRASNHYHYVLTGRTSDLKGQEALVLQKPIGVLSTSHIDYVKGCGKITQSIHTFTKDKKDLAQYTLGEEGKQTYSLSSKEPVLGNLKFSAKGTKREVFGMTLPTESSMPSILFRGCMFVDEGVTVQPSLSTEVGDGYCKRFLKESYGGYTNSKGSSSPCGIQGSDTGKNSTHCKTLVHRERERESSSDYLAVSSDMVSDNRNDLQWLGSGAQDEARLGLTMTLILPMFIGHYQPPQPQPQPPQPQQGPSDPIIIKRMGELEELITNLVEENQALEAHLGKQGSRINKLETMDLYPKMIREQTVGVLITGDWNRKINESR
ncbi:retrovirus-related pol polyprotein from transposon TNT 1-94 [Tanacetum coccineum]